MLTNLKLGEIWFFSIKFKCQRTIKREREEKIHNNKRRKKKKKRI